VVYRRFGQTVVTHLHDEGIGGSRAAAGMKWCLS
jgi:hypothetical protein